MTTLNARAHQAYVDLIDEDEREHPGSTWTGFEHQQDAFEEGWEAGYKAALADTTALGATVVAAVSEPDGWTP